MVDFWTNHFNVFAGKGADRWLLPAYDRDTIRPNAMAQVLDVVASYSAESGDAVLSRQLSECESERASRETTCADSRGWTEIRRRMR